MNARSLSLLAALALLGCGRSSPSGSSAAGAPAATQAAPSASVDPFDVANDAAEPTVALARDRGVAKGEADIQRTVFQKRIDQADERLRKQPDPARAASLHDAEREYLEAHHAIETSDEATFEEAHRRYSRASRRLNAQLTALGVPPSP